MQTVVLTWVTTPCSSPKRTTKWRPRFSKPFKRGWDCGKDDCKRVRLGPTEARGWATFVVEEAFQTGPMVLRRSSWEALWKAQKEFCEFDDYGQHGYAGAHHGGGHASVQGGGTREKTRCDTHIGAKGIAWS